MEGLRRTASFSLGLGFPSAAPTGNCPCLKEGKSHCCRQKQPEDSHEMGRSQKGPPKPLVAGPALLSCPSFSGIPFEPLDSWTPHRASETEKSPASCYGRCWGLSLAQTACTGPEERDIRTEQGQHAPDIPQL